MLRPFGVHVRALLFRHTAGILLQSIKTLRPNVSDAREVNAIVSRYKGVKRKCAAAGCVYTITLEQLAPLRDRLYRWKPDVAYAWDDLAPFIGFRETRLAASITVSSGVVLASDENLKLAERGVLISQQFVLISQQFVLLPRS
jgi:hypothetical protein